jgi:TolA protein
MLHDRWDASMLTMVAWSLALHGLVLGGVAVVMPEASRRSPARVEAYTVELTDPALLGALGRRPVGGPKSEKLTGGSPAAPSRPKARPSPPKAAEAVPSPHEATPAQAVDDARTTLAAKPAMPASDAAAAMKEPSAAERKDVGAKSSAAVKREAVKEEVAEPKIPKAVAPKTEAPKKETVKAEVPKKETPKAEVPKKETPKAEVPKKETVKAEAPKTEPPKKEAAKAEAAPVAAKTKRTSPAASTQTAVASRTPNATSHPPGGPALGAAASTGTPTEQRKSAEPDDQRYAAAIDRVRRRVKGGGLGGTRPGQSPSVGGAAGGTGGRVVGAEFLIYYNIMLSSIKREWLWVGQNPNLAVTVRFRIVPNGEIRNIKLDRPSGDPTYDESVLRAIRKANPLPPPPAAFQRDFSHVELTFRPGDLG